MSFERGLRSLPRQDPDVILVGETRQRDRRIDGAAALTGTWSFQLCTPMMLSAPSPV